MCVKSSANSNATHYRKEKQHLFIEQEVLYKNLDEDKTHMPKYTIWRTSEVQQNSCELWWIYPLVLPCRMEICYWGAKVWVVKSALTYCRPLDFSLLELSKRKMLPEVALVKSLCLSECLEELSCLGQCRTLTWSTVTPLTMPLKMQFSFLIPGCLRLSGEDEKKLQCCGFEAHPNRCFQLYFWALF